MDMAEVDAEVIATLEFVAHWSSHSLSTVPKSNSCRQMSS